MILLLLLPLIIIKMMIIIIIIIIIIMIIIINMICVFGPSSRRSEGNYRKSKIWINTWTLPDTWTSSSRQSSIASGSESHLIHKKNPWNNGKVTGKGIRWTEDLQIKTTNTLSTNQIGWRIEEISRELRKYTRLFWRTERDTVTSLKDPTDVKIEKCKITISYASRLWT